ncbi:MULTISPECIES: flagellar assembly peptidoglycan hydrolase FlgJ [Pseudomonas]|jgi:flagellar protein FlgJ|uniref:Peptidoglycan hydrolase FlgJ n=1 Tax=Pseudomonas putida (strain ATCC 47054 / DSM 6125 / CFBP 8728 / NCIMB 11950 / KT2440) TaxID=160488 RepID=Q88ES1_PSEPK|nr:MULTISPECIES: flagellar assembly peptidoglycan hydrolase FlgJ [Pseudomonas]AAN69960.1 Peptidoglycan hydrolase FlgJ [Pseudomonas putida KT2440]KMU96741.1 flagellar rod assembly protein FlgJ [Pseudomonas putida]KMY30027.1 flagellar rod assembly protein FlgJ [Pseudomonas putida]MBP2841367.1 flagellar assembly peptidoglycan hydrolase FlgJ [Pseudomonas sp. PNP]MDD2081130.1 flagellar assembly peptidoglycan hydrolase FlgJ [Pseudomonas putida]
MNIKSQVSGSADSGAYTDLNRLSALKHGDRDSEANVRKVAQEFESLFISEMLKASRKASDVLADDNPMNTETVKQYRDMYDQQLAVSMSREGGGIGLQDVLVRQLTKGRSASINTSPFPRVDSGGPALWGNKVAEPAHAMASSATRNDVAALNARRLALPSKLTDRLLAGIVPSAETANNAAVPARDGQAVAKAFAVPDNGLRIVGRAVAQPPLAPNKAFTDSDAFVATMLPMAEQAARRIGVDPRYLVAQAALETGWGKSVMRNSDGSSSHNLFGIKATGNWQGEQARAITSEFRDGQFVKETAAFRSYDSYQDSFHDLVTLLQSNARYQGALDAADNPEQFARELQKAGYATDPGYAKKIISIAQQMQSTPQYAMAGRTTNL